MAIDGHGLIYAFATIPIRMLILLSLQFSRYFDDSSLPVDGSTSPNASTSTMERRISLGDFQRFLREEQGEKEATTATDRVARKMVEYLQVGKSSRSTVQYNSTNHATLKSFFFAGSLSTCPGPLLPGIRVHGLPVLQGEPAAGPPDRHAGHEQAALPLLDIVLTQHLPHRGPGACNNNVNL